MKMIVIICAIILASKLAFSLPYQEPINPIEGTRGGWGDSINIRFVGNWPFSRTFQVACDSARNLAFCAAGGGVYVLDVSNPSNPIKLSEKIHSRGFIYEECLYDNPSQILYTIAQHHIELWDVSNATNPHKVSEFETPSYNTLDIEIQGSYVYALDTGLYVIDVSTPSNPQQVGFCDLGDYYNAIAVSGSYAYTVSNTVFKVIDISDPENPHEIFSSSLPGYDIFVADSFAYIAYDYYLCIMNISDPFNPVFAGSYVSPGYIHNLYVKGDYAYLANSSYFRIIDVSDPMNTAEVSNLTLFSYDITLFMPYAYIVGETSFNVVDISDPANHQIKGVFSTPGKIHDLVISGLYAFIASHESGLRIIDISDPENPWEVGYCHTPNFGAHGVFVSGSYAYVAAHEGLSVIDISTLSNPEQVGYCEALVFAFDVWVSGHYAYIAGYSFFEVIDISDPENPKRVGQCSAAAKKVCVSGQYAFAYMEDCPAISVIDISDPQNPLEVNTIYLFGSVTGIWISGIYLYAVDFDFGLYIIDISDPLNPMEVNYKPCNNFCGIYVSGAHAYVIFEPDELIILDISDPMQISVVGWYKHYHCHLLYQAVYSSPPYVYVGDNNTGLQIFEFPASAIKEEPTEILPSHTCLTLLQNPVQRNRIQLMLITNNPADCNIGLYNILGQEVKAFNLQNLSVGKNLIDLSVDKIPNGVYFLKVKKDTSIPPEKVVILK